MPRRRSTRRVNLRAAYNAGNYTGDYAWFVREKALPIIGQAALRQIESSKGSRVREYSVTKRNLDAVIKSLEIPRAAVKPTPLSPEVLIEIGKILGSTPQPQPTSEFPVSFRIPLHPISHNMLYEGSTRIRRSARYNKFRSEFFPMIESVLDKGDVLSKIDPTKPMEVIYTFGHREKSQRGNAFDRSNFQKAAQDCVFEFLGFDDSKVLDSSIKGEFVESYADGYMEFQLRNT